MIPAAFRLSLLHVLLLDPCLPSSPQLHTCSRHRSCLPPRLSCILALVTVLPRQHFFPTRPLMRLPRISPEFLRWGLLPLAHARTAQILFVLGAHASLFFLASAVVVQLRCCGRALAYKDNLTSHICSYTGENPSSCRRTCAMCSQSSSQLSMVRESAAADGWRSRGRALSSRRPVPHCRIRASSVRACSGCRERRERERRRGSDASVRDDGGKSETGRMDPMKRGNGGMGASDHKARSPGRALSGHALQYQPWQPWQPRATEKRRKGE